MANEVHPDWLVIGEVADRFGDPVTVAVLGPDVLVAFGGHAKDGRAIQVEMIFDGETRDEFIRAWAQAEFTVERNGSPVIRACCDHCDNSEASGHGYTLSGPHPGRCGQCAADQARREHDEGTD